MRPSLLLCLGAPALAASLTGCGGAAGIDNSTFESTIATETECQISTARILRSDGSLRPGDGAAQVRAILREPHFDCLGYDSATLDRLCAAAAAQALSAPARNSASPAARTEARHKN